MSPDNVRALHCNHNLCPQSSIGPLFDRCLRAITRQRPPYKRLSRNAREQWEPEIVKFIKPPQQRIVFFEALPKAGARLE